MKVNMKSRKGEARRKGKKLKVVHVTYQVISYFRISISPEISHEDNAMRQGEA
jgi:hypothetical protein